MNMKAERSEKEPHIVLFYSNEMSVIDKFRESRSGCLGLEEMGGDF